MSIFKKPYELSVWQDEWNPSSKAFVEKKIIVIGTHDMEYQGRAIEPQLIRKTNGEISVSFKMYYQFIDNQTGELIKNIFTDYICNETKIKLKYGDEWFDLLVKNMVKDSSAYLYTYQLENQHVVELSKNGFSLELDTKLMNNMGTPAVLAGRILEDTDWGVESETVVQTEDESLVMLTAPSSLRDYKVFLVQDKQEVIGKNGAVGRELSLDEKNKISGQPIYAFYSSCSGQKPHYFQFIYKSTQSHTAPYEDLFETDSNRIILDKECQYYITGIDPDTGWESNNGFVIPTGFVVVNTRENTDDIGNNQALSALYRGRRYVYTQIREFHNGLSQYLERYKLLSYKEAYWVRSTNATDWESSRTPGHVGYWTYYQSYEKPSTDKEFLAGDIVKVSHTIYQPVFLQVLTPLVEVNPNEWRFKAITVGDEYYKYSKTHYITPNLISNIITNTDFRTTSGWNGIKFNTSELSIRNIKRIEGISRSYARIAWDVYTTPGYTATWVVDVNEGEYFYLDKATVSDEESNPIYPIFYALESTQENDRALCVCLGATNTRPGNLLKLNLNSAGMQPSIEAVIAKIQDGKFITSTAAMLNNQNPIGDSSYSPYLACSNFQNLSFNGNDYLAGAIRNSGAKDNYNALIGTSLKDKFRFKIEFYILKKTYSKSSQFSSFYEPATDTNGNFKMRIANFDYNSEKHGYPIENDNAVTLDEGVVFSLSGSAIKNSTTGLYSYEGEIEALGSLSKIDLTENNYQIFLNFLGVPQNIVNRSQNTGENEATITTHSVWIKTCQFYRCYSKPEGGYYSLEDPIDVNNINYHIEDKFFPAINNDIREYEDILFIQKPNIIPMFQEDASKVSSINIRESNYYNAIQSIAETFQCWPSLEVNHNSVGEIINFPGKSYSKRVVFKNYVGQQNNATFKYGVNLKDIKRTLDSKQIVSKLIVKTNSNEYGNNGFCSISRASSNLVKDNVLYDFGYYVNQRLLKASTLQEDLYIASAADLELLSKKNDPNIGGLYTTSLITKSNVDSYLKSCSGYYSKMRLINTRLEELGNLIGGSSAPLNEEIANYKTYKSRYDSATGDLAEAQDKFYQLAGFSYDDIPSDQQEAVAQSEILWPILQTIGELASAQAEALLKYQEAERNKTAYESALAQLDIQSQNASFLKNTLNRMFYTRYSRFIQEGTWVDESYVDDNLYYNDAKSVLYTSAMPQVSYTINALALSGLPEYQFFDFKIGDQTYIEDIEFFGYKADGITPYQEKITITETNENLDDPIKNTIKVQNYENQFQDLFQQITATVQQVQYQEGAYKKTEGLLEADASYKRTFLEEALSSGDLMLTDVGNEVEIDNGGKGITIMNRDLGRGIRLAGGAIMLGTHQDNGDIGWKTGITADGISADLVTAGTVNTGVVQIRNGNDATFRWDSHGITAYYFDNSLSDVYLSGIDKNKGVRFDRFGLYGYCLPQGDELTGETWRPTGIDSGLHSVEEHSTFYLTWDGLKVTSDLGATLRIGNNARISNTDTSIFRINNGVFDVLKIDENGNLTIGGNGSIGQFQMVNNKLKINLADVDGLGNLYYGTKDWTTDLWHVGSLRISPADADCSYWSLQSGTDLNGNNIIKSTQHNAPNVYQKIQAMKDHYYKVACRVKADKTSTNSGNRITMSMRCETYPTYHNQDIHQSVNGNTWYTAIFYWKAPATEEAWFWFNLVGNNTTSDDNRISISSLCVKELSGMTDAGWNSYSTEVGKISSGLSYDKGIRALGVIADGTDPQCYWEDNSSDRATVELRVRGESEALLEILSDEISSRVANSQTGKSFNWKMTSDKMVWWNNQTETNSETSPLMLLNSSGLKIKGEIEADTGKIGGSSGWNIASGQITSGSLGANTGFHMYSTGYTTSDASSSKKYFGQTSNKTWKLGIGSNFGVDSNGSIYAKSGQIGEWNIGTVPQDYIDSTSFTNALYSSAQNDAIRYTTIIRPSASSSDWAIVNIKKTNDNREEIFGIKHDGSMYVENFKVKNTVKVGDNVQINSWRTVTVNDIQNHYLSVGDITYDKFNGVNLEDYLICTYPMSICFTTPVPFSGNPTLKVRVTVTCSYLYQEVVYSSMASRLFEVEVANSSNIQTIPLKYNGSDPSFNFVLSPSSNNIENVTMINFTQTYTLSMDSIKIYDTALTFDADALLPPSGNSRSIGNVALPWKTIYSQTFATTFEHSSGDSNYKHKIEIGKQFIKFYSRYKDGEHIYQDQSIGVLRDCARLNGTWKSGSAIAVDSSRTIKTDIENLPDQYDSLFDYLRPVRYQYINNKGSYHIGYILEELKQAMEAANLENSDLAAYYPPTDDDCGGIRYEELIALNTWQIQKLKYKFAELEKQINQI